MIRYAITDPSTLHFTALADTLAQISKKANMIVYRDKENPLYADHAARFMCEAKGFEKVLLHGDVVLAHTLGADGVHLGSAHFDDIVTAKKLGLFVVASTHTVEEALQVQALGADMITYSPIFETPNKGKAVGLGALARVCAAVKIPVVALGGILTQEQIDDCMQAGAVGFASIRYFTE